MCTIIWDGGVAARMRSKANPAVLIRDMPPVVRNRHCIPTYDELLYSLLNIIIAHAPFLGCWVWRGLHSKLRANKLFSRQKDFNWLSLNSL